ncbi:hypothetical protein CPI40_05480 [Moraxella catarrhalis]|nr:hypothetical protein [Moraxella catarrhalis]
MMMKNKWMRGLAILALSLPTVTYAKTAAPKSPEVPKESLTQEEQMAIDFCDFSAYGVMHIAAEHQSGVTKSEALTNHDERMAKLRDIDPETATMLDQYWKGVIDRIFQESVQKTDAEKQAFVMGVGESSFYSCLDQVLKTPKN